MNSRSRLRSFARATIVWGIVFSSLEGCSSEGTKPEENCVDPPPGATVEKKTVQVERFGLGKVQVAYQTGIEARPDDLDDLLLAGQVLSSIA